jgi:hypothetical protein
MPAWINRRSEPMRKTLMTVAVAGAALLGVSAKAAPLAAPIPTLAASHIQTVEWGYGDEWRHREWRRREEWERWHRHEAWERWHRWHEARERGRYYGW